MIKDVIIPIDGLHDLSDCHRRAVSEACGHFGAGKLLIHRQPSDCAESRPRPNTFARPPCHRCRWKEDALADESQDPESQRELVEHVRRVHLTLLAVCLGVVVVLTVPERRVERAAEDISALARVARQWHVATVAYVEQQLTAVGIRAQTDELDLVEREGMLRLGIPGRNHPLPIRLRAQRPSWLIEVGQVDFFATAAPGGRISVLIDFGAGPGSFTLGRLREVWDSLDDEMTIHSVEDAWPLEAVVLWREPGGKAMRTRVAVDWKSAPSASGGYSFGLASPGSTPSMPPRFEATPTFLNHCDLLQRFTPEPKLVLCSRSPDLRLPHVPAPPGHFEPTIDGIELLASWMELATSPRRPTESVQAFLSRWAVLEEGRRWKAADFASAFPELSSLTEGMDRVDLPVLESVIVGLKRQGSRELELFGTKIPAGALGLWGLVVIASVQLYLFLHLRQLARRLRRATIPEVGWIGLYQGRLDAFAAYASASLAPPVVLAIVAFQRSSALLDLDLAPLVMLGAAVLALAVVGAFALRRIRKTVSNAIS